SQISEEDIRSNIDGKADGAVGIERVLDTTLSLTVEVEGEGIAVNNDINGDETIELNGGLLPMEESSFAGNVVVNAGFPPTIRREEQRISSLVSESGLVAEENAEAAM